MKKSKRKTGRGVVKIAICNNKGGVGKTTTSRHLAHSFAKKAPTLIIDFDSQGNTTESESGMILEQINNEYNSISKLITDGTTDVIELDTNLYLISADKHIFEIINDTKVAVHKKYYQLANNLDKLLDEVDIDFKYVLIDCSPTKELPLFNALMAATHVLYVVEADAYSPSGLMVLTDIVDDLNSPPVNAGIKTIGAVVNSYEKDSFSKNQVSELHEHYPDLILPTMVPNWKVIKKSADPSKSLSAPAKKIYEKLRNDVMRRL